MRPNRLSFRPLALATLALAALAACEGDDLIVRDDATAAALRPLRPRLDAHGVVNPPSLVVAREAEPGEGPPDDGSAAADAQIGLTWSFTPGELQVYRSTAVHFRLDTAPAGHETVACRWNFGDGSPVEHGCNVSHTFHGGQADQVVTLTLTDGDWEYTATRTVPLERLPVTSGLAEDDPALATGQLPARPEPDATSFRFAVLADSAASGGVPKEIGAAVRALDDTLGPDLVIHLGGLVGRGAGESGWSAIRDAIERPLLALGVPVAFGASPTDLAEGARAKTPDLQIIDGRHYPERYSFTYKGAYFLVLSPGQTEGVTEDALKWMQSELAAARVYEARFVLSYLPLHKFGDEHVGTLDKKFRIYELLLRGRVTALFSAGYRVYFKGRYGALPVVSVGAVAEPGGRLSGSDFRQPSSLVVVDIVKGVPERIFGVEGPGFDRPFDEGLLPETVEVYTR